jgi:rubrerythrin
MTQLDLASQVQLGVTRGTSLEGKVDDSFKGEGTETGHYIAAARQAEREGYPEVALALRQIALEEAEHAARFCELNGRVDHSTRENLLRLLKEEQASCKAKKEAATAARESKVEEAHDVYDEASRDEARHAQGLAGLVQRYFNA